MGDSKSIIDLGELSRPATVLVEKISKAAGVLYEPRRIRQTAKANADAAIIKAESEVKIQDIHHRAAARFIEEEARNQDNIESITASAIPLLSEDSKPDDVEDDWLRNFYDKCKLVSDEDMRTLWAKILAGEANTPGSFAKRTVNFVSNMSKTEAENFNTLCRFSLDKFLPLIFDLEDEIVSSNGLNFYALAELDSIGLIDFNTVSNFHISKTNDQPHILIKMSYHDTMVNIMTTDEQPQLNIGIVRLTQIGQELARVTHINPINGYLEYIRTYYEKK